jgi:Short C-terminal domain/Phospholipase_D-nuclease N-terminal
MSLAASSSSYPLLNLFWTMLYFFMWTIWLFAVITVFLDIFRSHDLSGGAKALWFVFVLFIPVVGVVVYLIARGGGMHDRLERRSARENEEFVSYVEQGSGGTAGGTADQIERLAVLHDSGVLTDDEFEREKSKVLS